MKLLLDTHIALWAITGDPKLRGPARDLIADLANTRFVSAVTIWEIALKRRRSPASIPVPADQIASLLAAAGYIFLPVLPAHAVAVEALPPIHADPFDRMLVAQALHEPLRLITRDRKVAAYSDTFILA